MPEGGNYSAPKLGYIIKVPPTPSLCDTNCHTLTKLSLCDTNTSTTSLTIEHHNLPFIIKISLHINHLWLVRQTNRKLAHALQLLLYEYIKHINEKSLPALVGCYARALSESFTISRLPDASYQLRLGEQSTNVTLAYSRHTIARMMIIMVQSHAIRTRLNELQGGAL